MVSVSALVDESELRKVNGALDNISQEYGNAAKDAPKRAAIYLCASLKKRTRKAPRKSPPSEYEIHRADNAPHYLTYRRGVKLGYTLHRWSLARKVGTPAARVHEYYVYTKAKRVKGRMAGQDLAAERAELKKYHLGIFHTGLAKQSWGWAAHDVSGSGNDPAWKRRKRDVRNPREAISGSYVSNGSSTVTGGVAEIHNRLDYIVPALYPSALESSFDAATKKLIWYYQNLASKASEDFWASNGHPIHRSDWNALEKQLWPEAFAQSI